MFIPLNVFTQSQAATIIPKKNCGCGGGCCDEKKSATEAPFRDGVIEGVAAGAVVLFAYHLLKKL